MRKIVIVFMVLIILTGCGNQSTSSKSATATDPIPTIEPTSTPTPTVKPTETPTPEPKKPEDVLYDVVYQEDEMTGDRQYWSSYNYYYYKDNVIFPKDISKKNYSLSYFDLSLYEKNDSLSYFLTLRYKGDDWIFFDHWMVKVDDEDPVDLSLESLTPHRDVNNGSVTERYSMQPGKEECELLKNIANCKKCKIRFYGEKSFTFDLTSDEIKSTKHIVEMYEDFISGS